jgi:hypothetical protein
MMHTTRARNVFRAVAAVLGLVGVLNLSIAIPFDTKAVKGSVQQNVMFPPDAVRPSERAGY